MQKAPASEIVWKAFLIIAGLSMLALHIYGTTTWRRSIEPGTAGTLAMQLEPHDRNYRRTVLGMAPESPLHGLGIKIGDKIKLDNAHDANRSLGTDEMIGMSIFLDGKTSHVLVKPVPDKDVISARLQISTLYVINRIAGLLTLLISIMVGWRRPESSAVRALTLAFLVVSVDYNAYRVPAGTLPQFLYINSILGFMVAYCGFLYFALAFPEARSQLRRPVVRWTFAVFLALCIALALLQISDRIGILSLNTPNLLALSFAQRTVAVSSVLAGLSALWFSWRDSVGTTRQRIGWLGFCTGAIYISYLIANLNDLLGSPISRLGLNLIQTPTIILGYLGMAYALIRHRLFDISFAVNRALVFTIISTILLLVFSITEFAVDKLLHFEGREKNVIFDAAVALAIILSFHRIQHWVSHKIDHTFFHHWYAAASTLRRFVERAPHVVDASALQSKYMAAMQAFCSARDVAQYLRRPDLAYRRTHGSTDLPAIIAADSDLAIALRHECATIDLHKENFDIAAEYAFPMALRGEVNGIILLLPRADGISYRPDEIKLLGECIRSYALDLESLRVGELEREKAQLAQRTSDLESEVEALHRRLGTAERNISAKAAVE